MKPNAQSLARLPALNDLGRTILASKARILRDPPKADVFANIDLINHPADVPILLSAMRADVAYLVTFNRIHCLDDPGVAKRSGLRISTPGDGLKWVREQLRSQD